ENEKTVTQFCRKLAAERPLKDIRDEYNYPKKKGIKDECSRLLEASTMKSRRGFAIQRLMNLNIYNNYFKAPWMPDRTEANPNELNQDDARYGFRCCHLKNIWTAPLPPETELSRQMTTSTTSIDIMGLQAAYAN